jgi:hypothetical protein
MSMREAQILIEPSAIQRIAIDIAVERLMTNCHSTLEIQSTRNPLRCACLGKKPHRPLLRRNSQLIDEQQNPSLALLCLWFKNFGASKAMCSRSWAVPSLYLLMHPHLLASLFCREPIRTKLRQSQQRIRAVQTRRLRVQPCQRFRVSFSVPAFRIWS